MSAFGDRPPPSAHSAIDKVFELAREMCGSQTKVDRDDWLDWLSKVRENMRNRATVGTCDRCGFRDVMVRPRLIASVEDAEVTVEQFLCSNCLGPTREIRRCTVCGGAGHNRLSCALSPDNVKVGRAVRETP